MANSVFPEEIMFCILTRLPVKSILRFKSVCKPWRNLFSTPEFLKTHQGHFTNDLRNQSFLIDTKNVGYGHTIYLLDIDSNHKKPAIVDKPYPGMNFIGCCNGLICIGLLPLGHAIVLWNPAMRTFKLLDSNRFKLSIVDFWDPVVVLLGFGYDSKGDDFKVVRIVGWKNQMVEGSMKFNGVEVYSVNSNSWTTIKLDSRFQFHSSRTKSEVIVNGNPYWFAQFDKDWVLVWCDVTKLVFNIVPLPNFYEMENPKIKFVLEW